MSHASTGRGLMPCGVRASCRPHMNSAGYARAFQTRAPLRSGWILLSVSQNAMLAQCVVCGPSMTKLGRRALALGLW